jgi:hypothetical protein
VVIPVVYTIFDRKRPEGSEVAAAAGTKAEALPGEGAPA